MGASGSDGAREVRHRAFGRPIRGAGAASGARRAFGPDSGFNRGRQRGKHRCGAGGPGLVEGQALGEVGREGVDADALLGHGVALADGHCLVFEGVEVDRDAERGADLVLAAVAAADRLGVVELGRPALAEDGGEVAGLRRQVGVAGQREHRHLDRGEARVEAEHGALLGDALGVGRLVLGVRVEQEHQHAPVGARGGLDDVGDVPLARVLLQVGEVLAGALLVLGEVVVGAVGDALELAPLRADEVEPVLDVHRPGGVVRALLLRVLVQPEVVRVNAEAGPPVQALLNPVLVPVLVGARLDEELHLHLLELAGAEDEVARRDLVAKRLADLADAEGNLAPRGRQHVLVVDKDALRGLRPQVGQAGLVLDRAEVGAEQTVEVLGLGERAPVAAVRARDVVQAARRDVAVLDLERLDQVVGPEPLVAGLALGQRVGERGDVAAGLPDLGGEDDRGVEADDVVALLHHVPPPLALDVVLQLHAERSVVPRGTQTTVDVTGRVDESTSLAQVDNGIEAVTA